MEKLYGKLITCIIKVLRAKWLPWQQHYVLIPPNIVKLYFLILDLLECECD